MCFCKMSICDEKFSEVLMSHKQLVLRLLTKSQCITVAYTWGNKYQTFPWLTLVKIYLMSACPLWLNYFSLQFSPLYQCRQTSWWIALSLLPWRRLCFWMWAVIFQVFIGEAKHSFTFGGKCHCHKTFTLSVGFLSKYLFYEWGERIICCMASKLTATYVREITTQSCVLYSNGISDPFSDPYKYMYLDELVNFL